MKKQFLVITQTSQEKDLCAWWERLMKYTFDTQIFESFEEARKYMRQKIREEVDGSESLFDNIFCFSDDDYWEDADGDDLADGLSPSCKSGAEKIRCLTEALVSNADYIPEKIDIIKYTDDNRFDYAYSCNEEAVIASCNGLRLEYNIHKMDSEDYYYFDVFEYGEHQTHCLFSAKLINTGKTADNSKSISYFSSNDFCGRTV